MPDDCGGDLTAGQARINHTATTPTTAASNPAARRVVSGAAMAASNARRIADGKAAYSTPSITRTRANAVSRSRTASVPGHWPAGRDSVFGVPVIELKYRKKSLFGDSTIVVVSGSVMAVR